MKKMTRVVQKVNGEAIGLNVHKEVIVFSRLDRRGDEVASGGFPATHEALARKLAEGIWRLFALGECFDVTKPFGTPRAELAA